MKIPGKSVLYNPTSGKPRKLVASSANPDNLSLSVKGVLIGMIPLIIFAAGAVGVTVTDIELVDIIETVTTIVSMIVIGIGLGRKIFHWVLNVYERFNTRG